MNIIKYKDVRTMQLTEERNVILERILKKNNATKNKTSKSSNKLKDANREIENLKNEAAMKEKSNTKKIIVFKESIKGSKPYNRNIDAKIDYDKR